jgi:hypothetical protein
MQKLAWFLAAELACMHHERSDNPARQRKAFPALHGIFCRTAGNARNGPLSRSERGMTSPAWLAGTLAAIMILVAAAAAGRLCWRWLRAQRADAGADALHVLMGIAMAGMFEPSIGLVPAITWQVVFAAAAAWFAGQAIRRRGRTDARAQHWHPAAHIVECGAMLYTLWPSAVSRRAAGMPAMAGHAGMIAGNPAIALILSVGMLGYIVWAIDQILSRARLTPVRVTAAAGADVMNNGREAGAPAAGGYAADQRQNGAPGSSLAPRLAACQKITMGLAMGYMLITML